MSNVGDLCTLPELTDSSILSCLEQRYHDGIVYVSYMLRCACTAPCVTTRDLPWLGSETWHGVLQRSHCVACGSFLQVRCMCYCVSVVSCLLAQVHDNGLPYRTPQTRLGRVWS